MNSLKLKSIEVLEKRKNEVDIKIENFPVGEFTLLISDNAQGKSRLFRTLDYLSSVSKSNARVIGTNFSAKLKFEITTDSKAHEILYEINIEPKSGKKNDFNELITQNKKIIFSSKDNILFNETKKQKVENYFIPRNLPALVAIEETDFVTINLVRDFLQRVVYISSEKSTEVQIDPGAIIPDKSGKNIADVLKSWSKSYPENFNDTINELKQCFPYIEKLYFTETPLPNGRTTELLTFDEKNVKMPILQGQWSDGIYRILCLIMSTRIPFQISNKTKSPSLILVDEIENGLDFKRLKYIINYFQDYSDDSQIIISSHSPLVCDFVHPKYWIVVKRKGSTLNFISPNLIEKDIESQLEIYKRRHWDFYTKHISNSNLYIAKQ